MLSKGLFKLIVKHVFSPLFIGGLIYIFFRSTSLRLFELFEIIKVKSTLINIRCLLIPVKNELPSWFYFSLPDGLWVYSFSSALIILWSNQFDLGKYWLVFPLIFGAFIEIAQKIKIFPGTFDAIDIIFSISAITLSIITLKPSIQKNEKSYM